MYITVVDRKRNSTDHVDCKLTCDLAPDNFIAKSLKRLFHRFTAFKDFNDALTISQRISSFRDENA